MFNKTPLFIKVYKNEIEIKKLKDFESIKRESNKPFSSERLLIADFHVAEEFIRSLIDELLSDAGFFSSGIVIIIQAMELYEGGLSSVERRTYRDLGEHLGASTTILCDGSETITNQGALARLEKLN